MLVENVKGVSKIASMMKKSEFYIEVAKFVQAYTTIVNNPNEFLNELGQKPINEKTEKLTWQQFVYIAQNCDLGFNQVPTASDLLVYYNYALEIGTINPKRQKLASVDDVADAQKHYYNFIDEAKDRAEAEYLKQKRITEMREQEAAVIDNKLSILKTENFVCLVFMMFACLIGGFGIVSFLVNNAIATGISSIFGFDNRFVGAIVLVVIGIIMFSVLDKFYISTKASYLKLNVASETIFNRSDETYDIEQVLKRKYDNIKKDFEVVQAEINDETKAFDVKHNIEVLKTTNKYYQKLCAGEVFVEENANENVNENANEIVNESDDQQAFAPVKLTKEQEQGLQNNLAINLEGRFDVDAYNEKFEKSTKKGKEKQEEQQEEKQEEQQQEQKQEEQKQQQNKSSDNDLLESIDYIKSVLGFGETEDELEHQK